MMAENFADIFRDLSVLYELSLAAGQSLDLVSNCERFLSVLMGRKNLTFASVWIDQGSSQTQSR